MFTRYGAELSECACAPFTDISGLVKIKDAAKIDGCGPFAIFWRIILPLSKPGIFATGLIVFIFSWNEFPLSLVLLHDNDMRTAPVGISLYLGEYSFPWETISTATFLSIIPVCNYLPPEAGVVN